MEQYKRVFLDTDVIISALISKKGASYAISTNKEIQKATTESIKKEVKNVSKRLNLRPPSKKLFADFEKSRKKIAKSKVITTYSEYVTDKHGSHVLAGAVKTKSNFLLTYNIRHYKVDAIKRDFDIIVTKPGLYLQTRRNLIKI